MLRILAGLSCAMGTVGLFLAVVVFGLSAVPGWSQDALRAPALGAACLGLSGLLLGGEVRNRLGVRGEGYRAANAAIVASALAGLWGAYASVLMQPSHHDRQSRSFSNIRQLGLAVQQYSNDYDGAFPGWMNEGTKANPRYVHNCWDEQIAPFVKSKDVYNNGETGIKSPSQPGPKFDRVLTYGLNGALIAEYVDGRCDWSKPRVLRSADLPNAANTILFAEVSTNLAPRGRLTPYANPAPGTDAPTRSTQPDSRNATSRYQGAFTQWIDITPRDWVENRHGDGRDYREATWDADCGIARDLYSGGAVYAFADGHVAFQRLSKTTAGQDIAPESNWSPSSKTIERNQWWPGVAEWGR